jgi:hypothetical protein
MTRTDDSATESDLSPEAQYGVFVAGLCLAVDRVIAPHDPPYEEDEGSFDWNAVSCFFSQLDDMREALREAAEEHIG